MHEHIKATEMKQGRSTERAKAIAAVKVVEHHDEDWPPGASSPRGHHAHDTTRSARMRRGSHDDAPAQMDASGHGRRRLRCLRVA